MSDYCKHCGDITPLGVFRCGGCLAIQLKKRELKPKSNFCRHCGASIPPRDGEGACGKCNPVGVLRNQIVHLQRYGNGYTYPEPSGYYTYIRLDEVLRLFNEKG